MKQSEKLKAMIDKFRAALSPVDEEALMIAAATAHRLEAGEGFSARPVVSQKDGEPRVDACWMGMLAQITVDQARAIGLAFLTCAAEAETDASLLKFYASAGIDEVRAVSMVSAVRLLRESREPVQGEAQEPPAPQSKIIVPFDQKRTN
jgi:hypothetical protein